jgi:hypothetical protein
MNGIYKKIVLWINGQKTIIRIMVFYFPLLSLLLFLFIKIRWNNVYVNIIQEDSFLETAQFFAYGGAAILAFFAGLSCLKKGSLVNGFILLILTAFMMFVSLEEISWGQRIFGLSTPDWFQQHNTQREISVHNLGPIQRVLHLLYALVGFLFSFGWIPIKYVSSVRTLRPDVKATISFFTPQWYLMLYFVPTTFIYSYFLLTTNLGRKVTRLFGLKSVVIGNFLIWRDQEPAEFLLSLGFLLFFTAIVMRLGYISENGAAEQ